MLKKTFVLDAIIILVSTITGAVLRDNFETSPQRLAEMLPYFLATATASAILLPAFGTNKMVWRFSRLRDYIKLASATCAVTIGSVAIAFAFNRLDSVPRSLPFIQFNVALTLLVGFRVSYRLYCSAMNLRSERLAPLKIAEQPEMETVLLVGLSRLTDAYLQCVTELAPHSIRIAGLIGDLDCHVGRIVAGCRVLGTPQDIDAVLSDLEIRGVVVDKIVITAPLASFSSRGRNALHRLERSRSLQVMYLPQKLGLETILKTPFAAPQYLPLRAPQKQYTAFEIPPAELAVLQKRAYWNLKRTLDVAAALSLLALTFPLFLAVAGCVAAGIGRPVLFWQQRPGLGGRPFRLYKFRTMGAAYAPDGRRLQDSERMGGLGAFLRATRLDELPQLLNILRGDMSFIGPRPLLPRDQDPAYRARLLVRPGLTGWAQVVGGRAISAEDKAALDVWYLRNASLYLDLKIALKTIPIILFGETISRRSIEKAWRDLREAGVLRRDFERATPAESSAAEHLKAS